MDMICPICSSVERDSLHSSLCKVCGWEFEIFIKPNQNFLDNDSEKLKVRQQYWEEFIEVRNQLNALSNEYDELNNRHEELSTKVNGLEQQVYEAEVRLAEVMNDANKASLVHLQQSLRSVKQSIKLSKREIEDEIEITKTSQCLRLFCSLSESRVTIKCDKYPIGSLKLILGISKSKPISLIENADMMYVIYLEPDHFEISEDKYFSFTQKISLRNDPPFYVRFALNAKNNKMPIQIMTTKSETHEI